MGRYYLFETFMNPFFINYTKDSTKEDIKMFGIGVHELIIAIPVLFITAAIPITSIALIILMYIKINRIERMLTGKSNRQEIS
jgi:hypothetical protein